MNRIDLSDPQRRVIGRVLTEQARAIGDAVWLHADDRRVSCAEADAIVNRYANGLAAAGVTKGESVAFVMEPSTEAILLAVAVTRLGAVFTTINTDFRDRFLDEALRMSRARVLAIDAALAPRLMGLPATGGFSSVFVHGVSDPTQSLSAARPFDSLLEFAETPHEEAASGLDAAQVWWSSATTGKAKGVMHSHSSVLHQTRVHEPDIATGEVMYSCTPLYLGSAWTGAIYPSLVFGVTAAIDPRFSVNRFWERIRHYDATFVVTLGSMHMFVWKLPPSPDDRNHRLRGWQAVPLPSERIPEFKERYGIRSMHQAYGTSETFRVFELPDGEVSRRGAILGIPTPFHEVALLDEQDRPVATARQARSASGHAHRASSSSVTSTTRLARLAPGAIYGTTPATWR